MTATDPDVPAMTPVSTPDDAIRTHGLSKHYRHPWTMRVTRGLIDLDLQVRRGEVFGYLGPNGAGKTTTIKLLVGLLRPSKGDAWLLGERAGSPEARRRIGLLPEQPYFYDWLNGREYLEFVGRLSGLSGRGASGQAKRWLSRVGLGDRPHLALRKYSKGMLQRLGLASALLHDPELLILDEPMSGLDPFGRRDVREIILEQRRRGVTVMFSSHILPDVEMLCDRVGVVMNGTLVRTATVNELIAQHAPFVDIRCSNTPIVEIPARWRDRVRRVEQPEGTTFVLAGDDDLSEIVAWLASAGARLRAVTPQRASLEDFFVKAVEQTGGGTERSA